MSVNPVFGRIFVPSMIEQPTVAVLQEWMPTFLREIEAQQGLESNSITVPDPANYTSRNKFDALPGDTLPKVVVISPGLIGAPVMSGNREIRATWRLGVGVATVAQDEETAKLNCDIYAAAIRDIMLKKGGGAIGGKIHWTDLQSTDLPISNQLQQYRAAAVWFTVDIENVSTKRGGPATPNAEPYVYPIVENVDIDLEKTSG